VLSMKGKVAIVTGAGSVGPGWGNGRATATLLARQGAELFLVDINEDAVRETQSVIEKEGGTAHVHICDMTVAADVREMVQACITRFKRIDILVNNVGGSAPGDPVAMSEDVWDRQIDFNLKTAFLGCKYAIPVMLEQGRGAIVNIASVAGMRSGPLHSYGPAKAGVINLTQCLAAEWGPVGVRVNAVSPGFTRTPALDKGMELGTLDRHDMTTGSALGRLVEPEEIAAAVGFLASDLASAITGVNIAVDAGYLVATPWHNYGGLRPSAAAIGETRV